MTRLARLTVWLASVTLLVGCEGFDLGGFLPDDAEEWEEPRADHPDRTARLDTDPPGFNPPQW